MFSQKKSYQKFDFNQSDEPKNEFNTIVLWSEDGKKWLFHKKGDNIGTTVSLHTNP